MVNSNQQVAETTFSLEVPQDIRLREEIRRKVENFFSERGTLPPVSYDQLAGFADNLAAVNNWDISHKAFIMVCGGNAIWRPVVGSIPFSRRMLLLPQCLKNSKLCKGVEDELGLLCRECGNCNICGFLSEAENLGYITIVAEGTTIATRLVETGKVDAVIGVGCMAVLQKMFSSVTKYSIPAIGVPLLKCGCKDTLADTEWVKEEINHIRLNPGFSLLNINNLKEKTSTFFTGAVIDRLLGLNSTATDRLVKEMLMAGGKRIRPLLTVLAFEAFRKEADSDLLAHLAMSVECFHKASLVHDDIEDNDSFRYGKETIHTRYGIPVAINLGDLLIGEGYRLIAECGLSQQVLSECLAVVSRGHREMSLGQGEELLARHEGRILPVDEILTVFRNKTSSAFRVSLKIGAIASGADEKTLNLLDRFSDLIGQAYQMKDDIEDFTIENGFLTFQDQSVLVSLLAEKTDAEDRDLLHEALRKRDIKDMHMLAGKYHIRELVTDLLKEYLQKTFLCLDAIENIRLKLALNEIVGKIFGDYI